jgi:hypothetical protein
LAAVFYGLLMCIPTVTRFDSDHKPAVSFFCGPERALLRHERCTDPACHSWDIHEVSYLHTIAFSYSLLSVTLSTAVNITFDVHNAQTTILCMPKNLTWRVYVRFQVFTAVLLWVQIFSDVFLHWLVITEWYIEGMWRLRFLGLLGWFNSEDGGTVLLQNISNIPENSNFHQHRCEKLKSLAMGAIDCALMLWLD